MGKARNPPEHVAVIVDAGGHVTVRNNGPRLMTVSLGDGLLVKLKPGGHVWIRADVAAKVALGLKLPDPEGPRG